MSIEKYITVSLSDYMAANDNQIPPDREAVFPKMFHNGPGSTMRWLTVKGLKIHGTGFHGTTDKGEVVFCEGRNATIKVPISVLREV